MSDRPKLEVPLESYNGYKFIFNKNGTCNNCAIRKYKVEETRENDTPYFLCKAAIDRVCEEGQGGVDSMEEKSLARLEGIFQTKMTKKNIEAAHG